MVLKRQVLSLIWHRCIILRSIRSEALNGHEEGRGKSPNVRIGLRRLSPIQTGAAWQTLIFVKGTRRALRLYPVVKGRPIAWNFQHIKRLPPIGLVMTGVALHCFSHETEEEVYNRAPMTGEKRLPASLCQFQHSRAFRRLINHLFGPGLLVQRLVKVVQKVDKIFVTIVLHRLPEVLINRVFDCVSDTSYEAIRADIGRAMGRPHTLYQILVAEKDSGRNPCLV